METKSNTKKKRKAKEENFGPNFKGGKNAPAKTKSEDAPKETKNKKTKSAEKVELGRPYTISIALPGSIVANAQSPELKTYLVGQIARAVTIFNVDEVVVFCDTGKNIQNEAEFKGARKGDPNVFMARVLQYLETPQYLRKALFPVHPDLKYAGLLNPLDAPHHVRAMQDSLFREGVVVKRPVAFDKGGGGSWANIGLKKEVSIDRHIVPGVRVTVQIVDPVGSATRKVVTGVAVAPSVPREKHSMYWGYSTRLVTSFGEVWSKSPYKGGYDLSVGTSDRGSDATSSEFVLPSFRHLLIVFGGLAGLESCLQNDEQLTAKTTDELFDMYVNTCPQQGSRTIRTEEAIPITLSVLTPHFRKNQVPTAS